MRNRNGSIQNRAFDAGQGPNPSAKLRLSPPSLRFGDLKVRPKLIVMHNLFFLVLTSAVYMTLIPPFERLVQTAGGGGDIGQDELIFQAKLTLFVVLGSVYALSVLVLERLIMPRYVYQPLKAMLEADYATQHGDRPHEMIEPSLISGDEIGQIMRSRNATVQQLRRQEDDLENTLHQLEKAAADLTRKNQMLEAAKQSLEAQDRLASLGLLSASIAHEMNTPLAVLHGSVEKLLETVPDVATQERLARMLRVTKRLKKISEGLVDFARVRRDSMEPVDVRTLIEETWSLVAIDEKASEVHFRNQALPSDKVIGNSDRLIQVFVNLIRNALNAVPSGGSIWVNSHPLNKEGAEWISITVEDNGPGIPSDVLPEIFDAFVSSRLDARGTGLGLTVAEGIVQQHGGAISASNCPSGGARLEVVLRAASDGQRRAA